MQLPPTQQLTHRAISHLRNPQLRALVHLALSNCKYDVKLLPHTLPLCCLTVPSVHSHSGAPLGSAWPLYITDVPSPCTICGFRCCILFLCVCGGEGGQVSHKARADTSVWRLRRDHWLLFKIHAACGLTLEEESTGDSIQELKPQFSSQVTPTSINITHRDTIWPVISSCIWAVCALVCVSVPLCVRVWATPWQQPKSILSTGTPGFDTQRPLATEGNWFVCSVCSLVLSLLSPTDVIRGSRNWSAPKMEFFLSEAAYFNMGFCIQTFMWRIYLESYTFCKMLWFFFS